MTEEKTTLFERGAWSKEDEDTIRYYLSFFDKQYLEDFLMVVSPMVTRDGGTRGVVMPKAIFDHLLAMSGVSAHFAMTLNDIADKINDMANSRKKGMI